MPVSIEDTVCRAVGQWRECKTLHSVVQFPMKQESRDFSHERFKDSLKKNPSQKEAIKFLSSQKHHKRWTIILNKMEEGYELNEAIEFFIEKSKNPYLNEIATTLQQPNSLQQLEELKKDKKFVVEGERSTYQGGDLTSRRFF